MEAQNWFRVSSWIPLHFIIKTGSLTEPGGHVFQLSLLTSLPGAFFVSASHVLGLQVTAMNICPHVYKASTLFNEASPQPPLAMS